MEIKYNSVTHYYNHQTPLETIALNDINIEIKEKSVNGIIGKSGSGKTTLVSMINALINPTLGSVTVGEFNINKNKKTKNINALRKEVGIVFQFPEEQIFNSTVEKEIEFSLYNFNYKTDIVKKHVLDALKIVGLDESYLKRDPYTLSSGEIRKVAIASILAYNPKIIIFDEPTVGLDNNSQKNLINIIKKLKNRYNKTVIIVSHDMKFLMNVADNLYVMKNGKVVLSGSKKKVLSNIEILKDAEIELPKVLLFQDEVKNKKNVKLMYREDINDLIKDIYRHVK